MEATVQLNVRMPRELRDAGNAVLESRDISPSMFVRSVWEIISARGKDLEEVLAIVNQGNQQSDVSNERLELFSQGQHLYEDLLTSIGISHGQATAAFDVSNDANIPYHNLLEEAYSDRWHERGLDHA